MIQKQPSLKQQGLSTRSKSKAGVLSYVAMFENLWNQSELYQAIKESHEQSQNCKSEIRN